jgi:hypothetical protein
MPSEDEITEEGHTEEAELSSPKRDMSKWNVTVTLDLSMKCTITIDTRDETPSNWVIKRKWKEFKSLDSQLRSFHGTVCVVEVQYTLLPDVAFN